MSRAAHVDSTPRRGGHPSPIREGQTYGRLTAIARSHRDERKHWHWRFRCECGGETVARAAAVARGATKSCGCAKAGWRLTEEQLQRRRGGLNPNYKHGMTHSPEFLVWKGMLTRCANPNGEHWDRYGGRGIIVCERWASSFEAFFKDVGPRPSPRHSIERKDNDGNYEPSNCIWATRTVQVRNQSRSRMVEYRGRRMCLTEACEIAGLSYSAVRRRLDVAGWSLERALSQPIRIDARHRRAA